MTRRLALGLVLLLALCGLLPQYAVYFVRDPPNCVLDGLVLSLQLHAYMLAQVAGGNTVSMFSGKPGPRQRPERVQPKSRSLGVQRYVIL